MNSTAAWCTVCNNTQDRGCGALALAASQASAAAVKANIAHHQPIGPVGAGFLGAGLTLAVVLAMFGVLAFLGMLTVGRGRSKKARSTHSAVIFFHLFQVYGLMNFRRTLTRNEAEMIR